VREKAADLLGELRDERGIEALVPAIQDAEESVSKAVAKALVRINSARAVEPLIQTLQSGKKGRRWVAFALGELRDSRAADPLVRALRDEDAGVRAQAARALATTAGQAGRRITRGGAG